MKPSIVLVFLFLGIAVLSATNIPGGQIAGNWILANSPYIVQGDITIPLHKTLNIQAGVEVRFESMYEMKVLGRIRVNGSEEAPVRFTSNDPNWRWKGLRIVGDNYEYAEFSDISHAIIERAQESGISVSKYGKAVITNTVFRDNDSFSMGGGLCVSESTILVNACQFIENRAAWGGGAIYLSGTYSGKISNSRFENNYSFYGGALVVSSSVVDIENNEIVGNYSADRGGGIVSDCQNGLIRGNVIRDNYAVNEAAGVGLMTDSYHAVSLMINNTIVNNRTNGDGGGISIWSVGRYSLKNNIIRNNIATNSGSQVYIYSNIPSPIFDTCNIQGGFAAFGGMTNYDPNFYINCTEAEPLFVGIGPYAYMPRQGSNLINSGNMELSDSISVQLSDLTGNPRVYGDRIDIGALEWQGIECDFSISQNGNIVTFTPNSNVVIQDIHWDFNMDGVIDSNDPNPTYVYSTLGNYDVGFYINGGLGGIVKSNCIQVTTANEDAIQPVQTITVDVYPNPFMDELQIRTIGDIKGETKISIYDVKGQLITDMKPSNGKNIVWNGCDSKGSRVANGIYFVRFQTDSNSVVKKIAKLK